MVHFSPSNVVSTTKSCGNFMMFIKSGRFSKKLVTIFCCGMGSWNFCWMAEDILVNSITIHMLLVVCSLKFN